MLTLKETYYGEDVDPSSIKDVPYFNWLVSQLDYANEHDFKNKMKIHDETMELVRDEKIARIVREFITLKDEWEKSSALERYEKFKEMESKRRELESATQGRLSPFLEHALVQAIKDIESGVLDLNNLPSSEEIEAVVGADRKKKARAQAERAKKEREPEWGPGHPRWTYGT